ncbi:MAG TPA: sugar-binding protein [Tepidisphaeraceae bacterium]|nr:sugar-binding protein [Tepidisphaeraceae bacterium]
MRIRPLIFLLILAIPSLAAEAPKTGITLLGHIDYKPCSESSGVVASRRHPGVYWTHCDSGNDASIYAITREGKFLAEYKLNVKNDDWEDIAIDDDGHLFIGDIGNNGGKHKEVHVHRVDEPDPATIPAGGIAKLKVDKTWKISYPDSPFDAESLFILKEHGYIVSKLFTGLPATIYRFPLREKKDVTLERVTSIAVHSPATAADISPDGKRLAVLSLGGLSIFQIDGDPANAGKVDPISMRFIHPSAEGCCFAPDGIPNGIIVTAESREVWLFIPPEPAAVHPQPKPQPAPAPPRDAAQPQAARVPTTPQFAMHALAKPPTIDAKLDDWDLKSNELSVKAAHRHEANDKTARAWAGWTDKGIYLAAIIPADGLNPLEENWYSGDAVEVFIGQESSNRSTDWTDADDRCYLGFAKAADGTLGEFQLHWPRHDDDKGPADAKAAGAMNKDGAYQLELFLPAALLGETAAKSGLQPGSQLRFNISILTKKPRRNWYVGRSNSDGCWVTPLNWAVVTLEK